MGDVLTTFLTPALTGIVLGALFLFVRRANDKKLLESEGRNHVIVRPPRVFLWVGVAGIPFFLFASFMSLQPSKATGGVFEPGMIWTSLFFFGFVLMGVSLILMTLNCKFHIFRDRDHFLCTSMFGRTRTVRYADIVHYEITGNILNIKAQINIHVDSTLENLEVLLEMLRHHGVRELKAGTPGVIVIHHQKLHIRLGIGITSATTVFILVMIVNAHGFVEGILTFLCLSPLLVLFAVLLIQAINLKVEVPVDGDHFVYTTWLKRTYTIRYSDIVHFTHGNAYLIIKTDRYFFLETTTEDYEFLVKMLRKHKVKRGRRLIEVVFRK